ncbi:nucleolar and spindle-associated protein 1 isoform X2 [Dendrobates tinctorius]|uniref:nucleolar and spindle-associated protein 1 isoform X2 n=1 Tax=Dendrobates tinctorius TaxID=92724 RepID=UPI003CCA44B2
MEAPSVDELETLKYPELRKLAKAAGLKANLKANRLLRTLKAHFHPAVVTENSSSDSDGNSTLTDDTQGSLNGTEQVSICHVTNRCGRGKKNIKADSSPEMKDEIKHIQGESAENDTKETSIPVPTSVLPGQQNEEVETRETKDDTAKITTRRRSKRNPSSGKKRRSKIPKRDSVSKAGSKPSTPNFKRMHEAHFKKMESIDKYLERKQKRLDAISSTIQDVKMLTKNSNQKTPGSNTKKSTQNRFSLLSPVPQTGFLFSAKTPSHTRSAGKRSILVDKSGGKASTYSSSKMNVRFSGATKDNEHKYSLVKTPARKSSTFVPNNGEPRKSLPQSSVKATPATKETKIPAAITPFKFTAENIATPNNSKKMKFDLQASLSRPLGYQPHKGKLKPWRDTKENTDAVQSKSSILKNTYKQPHLPTSRDTRRKELEKDRKSKREKTFGSHRGVAIP